MILAWTAPPGKTEHSDVTNVLRTSVIRHTPEQGIHSCVRPRG
jgi:hypothetical protein